jgi:hypothetical protein
MVTRPSLILFTLMSGVPSSFSGSGIASPSLMLTSHWPSRHAESRLPSAAAVVVGEAGGGMADCEAGEGETESVSGRDGARDVGDDCELPDAEQPASRVRAPERMTS